MPADREIPMPPSRYDPDTGRGPTVVAPDRCPRGHRHGQGTAWNVLPVRPGSRVHHWVCWSCPREGQEFWATVDLYDVDPATWYWDPYQAARREEFEVTMQRIREHRAKYFVGG